MAKWYGMIGFAENVEVEPGVWEDDIVEHSYFGDVTRNTRRLQGSGEINDNIGISNQISILADPYANQNIYAMRYAVYMGVKWKITDVEVQFPRLILSIGELWNGNENGITE